MGKHSGSQITGILDIGTLRENRLLARLPDHALDELLAEAEIIECSARSVVLLAGEQPTRLHFPLSGMASLVTADASGRAVEVATVGREGMLGVTTIFGAGPLPFEVMWQIPGRAATVDIGAVRRLLDREPLVAEIAARYLGALIAQTGQNAGCNRMHNIEQRAAKWLLLCLDRTDGDAFPLSHEFFAIMLGVTRPKLSLVQATFQRAGLIAYSRGVVTVLDRQALEEQACDCYAVIAGQLDALEGGGLRAVG